LNTKLSQRYYGTLKLIKHDYMCIF